MLASAIQIITSFMIGPGKRSMEVDYNVVIYLLVTNSLAILSLL